MSTKNFSKKSKIAKNNRKRTVIMTHQKVLIITKIESIGPNDYHIVLSHPACITNIVKCLRCDSHPRLCKSCSICCCAGQRCFCLLPLPLEGAPVHDHDIQLVICCCFVHYFNCKYLFLNWKFENLFFCRGWDCS